MCYHTFSTNGMLIIVSSIDMNVSGMKSFQTAFII